MEQRPGSLVDRQSLSDERQAPSRVGITNLQQDWTAFQNQSVLIKSVNFRLIGLLGFCCTNHAKKV